MIRAWQAQLAIAAALLGVAFTAAPDTEHDASMLEAAVRPFVLPTLWARADAASATRDPAEALSAGRTIAELLPSWTDGRTHVAWVWGFELGRDDGSRDRLADLLAAIDWLREGSEERAAAGEPEDAAELLMAAATLIRHRTTESPELGERMLDLTGHDPSVLARELVERAATVAPSDATRARLAFATLDVVAGALRMGELARAEASKRFALRALAPFAGRADADAAIAALERLRPFHTYLDDDAALDSLREDPMLADVADALRALAR